MVQFSEAPSFNHVLTQIDSIADQEALTSAIRQYLFLLAQEVNIFFDPFDTVLEVLMIVSLRDYFYHNLEIGDDEFRARSLSRLIQLKQQFPD